MSIVIIGPPAAGKSTVGRLLAERVGRDFVDADEVAGPLYAEVGWSVERLRCRSDQVGYEAAHAEWETALAYAVERLVELFGSAVIALGAGHTHLISTLLFERVRVAVGTADQVVLLRPAADSAVTIGVLRKRSISAKGHDWRVDGVDWLERWTTDGRDELLATAVIYNDGELPEETARRVESVTLRS